jgi:hypothetical protein
VNLILTVAEIVAPVFNLAGMCRGSLGHWAVVRPAPVAIAVLVLQVETPVAVTSYLLAEKYGADSDAVAGLVVVSTLMAVIALPVTLAFVM